VETNSPKCPGCDFGMLFVRGRHLTTSFIAECPRCKREVQLFDDQRPSEFYVPSNPETPMTLRDPEVPIPSDSIPEQKFLTPEFKKAYEDAEPAPDAAPLSTFPFDANEGFRRSRRVPALRHATNVEGHFDPNRGDEVYCSEVACGIDDDGDFAIVDAGGHIICLSRLGATQLRDWLISMTKDDEPCV